MKKFLAIFLALVLTMALLAGCAAKQATEAGQTAKTAETVKIVLLLPGDMIVVAPEDAHKPRCAAGEPEFVRKVVVKVKV